MTVILDKIEELIQKNGYQKKSLKFIEKELLVADFKSSQIIVTFEKIKKNKIKHLTINDDIIHIDLSKKIVRKQFHIEPVKKIFEKFFKLDDINLKLLFLFFSIWMLVPFLFYSVFGPFDLLVKTNVDIISNSNIYEPNVEPRVIHYLFSTIMLFICIFICLFLFLNSGNKIFFSLKHRIIEILEKINISLSPEKYKILKKNKPDFVNDIYNLFSTLITITIFVTIFLTFALFFSFIIRGFYIYGMIALFAFVFWHKAICEFIKNAIYSFLFFLLLVIISILLTLFLDIFSENKLDLKYYIDSSKFLLYFILFVCFIFTSKKEIFNYLLIKNYPMDKIKKYTNLLLILILSPIFFKALLLINGFNISNLFYIDVELHDDIYGILKFIGSISPDVLNFVDNLSFIENNKLSFLVSSLIFLKSKIVLASIITFIYMLFFRISNLNLTLKIIYYFMIFSILSNVFLEIYLYKNLGIYKMKDFHYQTFLQSTFMILLLPIIKDISKDNFKINEFQKVFVIGLFLVLFFSYLFPFLTNVTWISNQNYIAIFLFLVGLFAVRGSSFSLATIFLSLLILFNEVLLVKDFKGNNLILIIYTLATLKDQIEIKIGKKMMKFFI